MLIGYARVSKADGSQSLDLQHDALRAAGVERDNIYDDLASGGRDDRPGLTACLKSLRDGDVLVVDRAVTPRKGMVVVAVVRGDFTCKQLDFEGDRPVLRAGNPDYPDIHLRDGEELEIFGVVRHCVRDLLGA